MPILEPVSGQVGLRFLGKVISGCRDRTAITSVEAVCENPETKSNGRKGADTWVFGAAPGNLCGSATDWWSNEDSNQGSGQFYRWRAIGSVRDRGRSRTPPRCDSVWGSCNVGVNPPWVQRFQAVGTVRAKMPEGRKGGKSRRREVAVHRSRP
jgi:hypothetical protein